VNLPANAIRCPTCGHHQGDALTIEVGRRSGGAQRSTGPHRRRDLIILGGVVALVVGGLAFVGRDSGGRESAAASTTTTTLRPTTTSSTSSTTTTAPTTTTATTLPGLQLGEPTGIKLVIGNEEGFVALVDLDTGATSRPSLRPAYAYLPRADGLVLNTDAGHVSFVREPYDQPGTDLGAADGFFASASEDRLWIVRYTDFSVTLTEIDLAGAVKAGPFNVPQAQMAGSVTDGVVLSSHGSIYVVDRAGTARRIASGDAVAASGDFVFAVQCDDHLVCGAVLINATTGGVRAIPELGDTLQQGFPMVFSPDGSTAAALITHQTEATSLLLIDLASGRVSTLVMSVVGFSPMPPSFSRDSRWLFFTTGLETSAYRLGSDEKRTLSLGGNRISSLAAV
jgi:hypothetical protein